MYIPAVTYRSLLLATEESMRDVTQYRVALGGGLALPYEVKLPTSPSFLPDCFQFKSLLLCGISSKHR